MAPSQTSHQRCGWGLSHRHPCAISRPFVPDTPNRRYTAHRHKPMAPSLHAHWMSGGYVHSRRVVGTCGCHGRSTDARQRQRDRVWRTRLHNWLSGERGCTRHTGSSQRDNSKDCAQIIDSLACCLPVGFSNPFARCSAAPVAISTSQE